MDFEQENAVWVIGHRNPDTDSICAAIAYADLQNHLSETKYEPKRAGNLNEETKYVLRKFKVKAPAYVDDVRTQLKDIAFRRTIGVSSSISLKRAWELMTTSKVVTLPITGENNELLGLIVNGDIAESYMDVLDAERSLFGAEIQLAGVRAAHLSSIIHVCMALGGGWEEAAASGS